MSHPRYPWVSGDFILSNSDAMSYLRCPLRYFYDQEVSHNKTTVPLLVGSAIHLAAEFSDKEVISGNRRPAIDELVGYAVESYKRLSDKREVSDGVIEVMRGKQNVEHYARELWSVLLDTSPVASEQQIATNLPCGTTLVGTLDVVTADGFVDRKTGRPWTQDRADRSPQFSGYALLYDDLYGKLPQEIVVDSLSLEKKVKVSRVETQRIKQDVEDYKFLISKVRYGIHGGYDAPACEGSWWCSAKWCPHFRNCVAVQGRVERDETD